MKLHSLQALRAIAAWLVIVDHALLEVTRGDTGSPVTQFAWMLGSAGVDLFFAISGFIMVHISWDSFGRRAAGGFLQRRIIRIVPLYWLATLVALAYHKISATHGAHAGWSELIDSFAFIPHLDEDGAWAPILPQGWTLSYEMMFYAFFTIGLCFPRRSALPAVGLALVVLVAAGPFQPSAIVAYLASPIILWFLLGIVLAVLWHQRDLAEPGWLARSAESLEPFGDASYSTYLVHGLVLTAFLRAWNLVAGSPSYWIVPWSLVIATVAGWLVHRGVERPLLRIVTDLWKPRRTVPTGLPPQARLPAGLHRPDSSRHG